MDRTLVLKAIADETRMKILTLLLQHNYCVRALARKLALTEPTVSQHLKVLKEAGLLTGEKKGYFMHYDVNRSVLHELAREIEQLAAIEREACTPAQGECPTSENQNCHVKEECSDEVKVFCHGNPTDTTQEKPHGHCKCHRS